MSKVKKIILIVALSAAVLSIAFAAVYSLGNNKNTKIPEQSNKPVTTVKDSTVPAPGEQTDNLAENTANAENPAEATNTATPRSVKVKALYLSGPTAGSSIDHYIELVKDTELNALVIDVKEAGVVSYESSIPEVTGNKLYRKYYNPRELVKKLHDNGVYAIARIVVFRDQGLASKRNDLAVKKSDGSLWREGKMGPWTNPYNEEVWDYNIKIAKEAADFGFDEIQFDYVRFPTSTKSNPAYYGENPPAKDQTIAAFLKKAKAEIQAEKGIPVSADVFGIVCESVTDGRAIGQSLELVGKDIDYISPMVYPSHYAVGQIVNGVKFDAPDLKPYDVVYNTLLKCKNRISKVEGYKADVRPYLQDFTASYLKGKAPYQQYGPDQIRDQIQAVYDAGYEEWIFWDGSNTYTESAFKKEK